ncbi:uncharacterized protein F4807DRAFT_462005 [Annulohypoxylon truncatum]|uniref:uncharacterized protein n=1 Tax=Annulohypoxylon truncatum TaxID=327061 RepID=UPI002008CEE9|nr:uncharacterized protein F4807DRAFT_462005 [Annulohypoxylon truncatum]KAI1208284.1 hypothetical protein F4807DRAFT_462005 [Annulohypoxylon truncatum]
MAGTTSTSTTSSSSQYLQDFMADYAFKHYQYILTPQEIHEITTESYWDNDVDAFCNNMIEVNFGESIPGTNNVKLPSTLRIYTNEEVEAMEAAVNQSSSISDLR